jgi:hypothetical protein
MGFAMLNPSYGLHQPPAARKISVAFRQRPDRMQMVRQDDDGFDVERMASPKIAERLAQEVDVIDEKTQAALSQIGREEKAAAADKVSPMVRHRASIAELKVMGFAEPVIGPATPGRTRWLNHSYGLGWAC